jgi:dethiobiotin synthetase
LLSLEALKLRRIPVLGIAFIGGPHPDNEHTLAAMGGVPVLGRLPHLNPLTSDRLQTAFAAAFPRGAFTDHSADRSP